MQLFTSCPFTIIEQAPQLPVSQPMWLPVRSRSSRTKWISSLRASTSRSYSTPLTVTVTAREEAASAISASLRSLTRRTHGQDFREVDSVLARRVDVRRRRELRAAHGLADGVVLGRL